MSLTGPMRRATHAGSWYSNKSATLTKQLESYIEDTDSEQHELHGCRVIISPHAGYSYSGATAAFGFKALNWSKAKRIFILGPSHHVYLKNCALSRCKSYATPLGQLNIDLDTIAELRETKLFADMDVHVDEDEHSIEMQLPYLRLLMSKHKEIPVVPILVGNLDHRAEKEYGELLARYLVDESNLFVISSDFCHWGNRFNYSYYEAKDGSAVKKVKATSVSPEWPIWQSIEAVDTRGIDIIQTGDHDKFTRYLAETGNTICGRHPIGVILAAFESAKRPANFRLLDYQQSNRVTQVTDGSVSYASLVCRP